LAPLVSNRFGAIILKINCKKLLLLGYFGTDNIGDEAILSAQISNLKANFNLKVFSHNPHMTQKRYNVECEKLPSKHKPRQLIHAVKTIAWSDALIVGGGGFIANKLEPHSLLYWAPFLITAKLFHKKVILFAAGCGPFKPNPSLALFKILLNKLDAIILRDSTSEEFIKQLNITTPTKVTADIAFLLKTTHNKSLHTCWVDPKIDQTQKPRVLFVLCKRSFLKKHLTEDQYNAKHTQFVSSMSQMADFVIQEMGGTPLFLPFTRTDQSLYEEIVDHMVHKKQAVKLSYEKDLDYALSIFNQVDIVVGERYHSLIFSLITEKPALPIIYHPKNFALAKKMDLREKTLETGAGIEWPNSEINVEKAKQILLDIYKNMAQEEQKLKKKRESLEICAAENLNTLMEILQ
jgi:polysaccharide pyruvyl transferase CsaB